VQPPQLPAEGGRVDVVHERALAADLDDREPLPIAGLELRIARDVHLRQLERELVAQPGDDCARPLAEVASLGVVEDDLRRYG
jgi:hypothetical protein